MQILVKNLTNQKWSVVFPLNGGRLQSHYFQEYETLDIGEKVTPWELDLSPGTQLRTLRDRGLFEIDIIPDAGDVTAPLIPSGGVTGNEQLFSFTYTSMSNASYMLTNLSVGQVLSLVDTVILTPFDGASPTLQVGTPLNPSQFLSTPLSLAADYQNTTITSITSPDILQLSLSLGGSTQGQGNVYWRLKT